LVNRAAVFDNCQSYQRKDLEKPPPIPRKFPPSGPPPLTISFAPHGGWGYGYFLELDNDHLIEVGENNKSYVMGPQLVVTLDIQILLE